MDRFILGEREQLDPAALLTQHQYSSLRPINQAALAEELMYAPQILLSCSMHCHVSTPPVQRALSAD